MMINELPVKTWNWLRMNGAEVSFSPDTVEAPIIEERTAEEIRPGFPESAEKVYQTIKYDTGVSFLNSFTFDVREKESRTVIQEISSEDSLEAEAQLKIDYHVGAGAELTLVQVQTLGGKTLFRNAIEGEVGDGGTFRLIQLFLGGGKVYTETKAALSGEKSAFEADIAYRLSGEEKLDMNYVANHTGKRSQSNINVSGVMEDKSHKLFRGTIDFHKGCAGAKGSELEDVLLLNEGVINQTIPLILCDEEDVEGSHGATIGRLSEELLFYLSSRGIPEEEIYRMMARARIDTVANKIPDERTRERVAAFLDPESTLTGDN